MHKKLISIVIPVYNEKKNIPELYKAITVEWRKSMKKYDFELIFVDDGSQDDSVREIEKLIKKDDRVRLLEFSRNFGKEMATTAGIRNCKGDACIMVDADLQHPIDMLSEFIKEWDNGTEVVIGVRKASKSDSLIKKMGGTIFYKIMHAISDIPMISHATDYRLLDRVVINEFNKLSEHNRITRGLIDWLGFRRSVIYFEANDRFTGNASYSTFKLFQLAFASVVSLSMLPLRIAGYLGIFIVFIATVLGIVEFIDRYFIPWGFNFSGPAILATIILFLVGVILISLGLLAFYIGHIYHESQGRPMYVIRKKL